MVGGNWVLSYSLLTQVRRLPPKDILLRWYVSTLREGCMRTYVNVSIPMVINLCLDINRLG